MNFGRLRGQYLLLKEQKWEMVRKKNGHKRKSKKKKKPERKDAIFLRNLRSVLLGREEQRQAGDILCLFMRQGSAPSISNE